MKTSLTFCSTLWASYKTELICDWEPGNGYITTATLRDILHELDDKLTPDDLDGIIDEIDEDGSGTIDFDGIVLSPIFRVRM